MEMTNNPYSLTRRYHIVGWTMCLISAVLFSSKAVVIKLAYQYEVDAASLLSLRMAMALPVYLLLTGWYWHKATVQQRILTLQLVPKICAVGLLGYYLASLFDFAGLVYVSAQLERIVLFSYPLWVVLIGYFAFGQPLKKAVRVALPLCWLGIMVSMSGGEQFFGRQIWLGVGLILISAISFALYTLMARSMIQAIGGGLFTSLAMASAAIGSIVHVSVAQGKAGFIGWPQEVYTFAFYMAIFATVIPSYLFSEAVKRLGSDMAATTSSIGPVATSVMAVLILGESFGLRQALGLILVLMGVAWLSRKV